MKEFILRIQNSDEQTKKFWLVVFSAVTMVSVVGMWVMYVKVTFPSITPAPETAEIVSAKVESPGFFSVFAAGLKIIYDGVSKIVAHEVATKNNIVIENPKQNFSLEGIPTISPTKL